MSQNFLPENNATLFKSIIFLVLQVLKYANLTNNFFYEVM